MRDRADRFDGLAKARKMHRKGYPQASFRTIAADPGCDRRVAAGVGAGPGNLTGPLMAVPGHGWSIAGIAPGRDTRRVLSRRCAPAPQVRVPDATAKEMLLSAGPFVKAHVPAPGGAVALLRNRRKSHPGDRGVRPLHRNPLRKASHPRAASAPSSRGAARRCDTTRLRQGRFRRRAWRRARAGFSPVFPWHRCCQPHGRGCAARTDCLDPFR